MKIQGVIFDMDGLMIDTEKHYNRFLRESAAELGYPMTYDHALLLRSLDEKLAGPLMVSLLGEDYCHEKVIAGYNRRVDAYFSEHEIEIKPGLFTLLEYLKEKGYQTCVATSTQEERAEEFLKKIQVREYFSQICSGYGMEHSKPAPDIYMAASKKLGLAPGQCMALEDSPNGVRAAAAAGCFTVMVPDLTQPDEELKTLLDGTAQRLDEVPVILESL